MPPSVRQLKDEARRAEKREDWDRAIQLYERALRVSEEAGDYSLDLSLYNRIGDLHRRRGATEEAVECYREAVDRYADQGLYTGAIALCNKILRLEPEEVEIHRSLGRLHAETGLVAEARNNFRQYARAMQERGEPQARLEAYAELARLTDDLDLLLEVAEAMVEEGQEEEAREVLLREWEEGDGERPELRRRLLALDAGAAPDEGAAADADDGPDTRGETDAGGEVDADVDAGVPSATGADPAPEGDPATTAGPADAAGSPDVSDPHGQADASEGRPSAEAGPRARRETGRDRRSREDDAASPGETGREAEEPSPAPTGETPSVRSTSFSFLAEEGDGEPRSEGEDAADEAEGDRVDLGERIRRRLGSAGDPRERGPVRERGPDDFDDMLLGFRAQAGETDGEADPEAHLELGVAFQQMGLLDDAIREFQAAARAPEPPLRALELLGSCFLEKGLQSVAVRVLNRALRLPGRSDHELLGVLYQLGVAYQQVDRRGEALDCYERVYSVDIDFRDVESRMEAVRPAAG
jgi:tetratricopeptide (TPR) repeat protein